MVNVEREQIFSWFLQKKINTKAKEKTPEANWLFLKNTESKWWRGQ